MIVLGLSFGQTATVAFIGAAVGAVIALGGTWIERIYTRIDAQRLRRFEAADQFLESAIRSRIAFTSHAHSLDNMFDRAERERDMEQRIELGHKHRNDAGAAKARLELVFADHPEVPKAAEKIMDELQVLGDKVAAHQDTHLKTFPDTEPAKLAYKEVDAQVLVYNAASESFVQMVNRAVPPTRDAFKNPGIEWFRQQLHPEAQRPETAASVQADQDESTDELDPISHPPES